MPSIYDICPCNSGKKFKFCCYDLIKNEEDAPALSKVVTTWPLHSCSFGKNWQEKGLTTVFIARTMPHGNYLVGMYLVDAWCLGVKNADIKVNITPRELQNLQAGVDSSEKDRVAVSYQAARSLVLGSIKYAESLGFPPHPDWEPSQILMDPNEPFEDKFVFGKDGEPMIVGGDPELFEYLGNKNPFKPSSRPRKNGNGCGLCGKTKKLTKTECCNQTICDDLGNYVLFSYERNSCSKNHEKYTLCAFHFHNKHEGKWQDCSECKNCSKMEMYVYSGTNEYNFETLENPPHYEPTRCDDCSKVIRLGMEGYSIIGGKYLCMACNSHDYNLITQFSSKENQEIL